MLLRFQEQGESTFVKPTNLIDCIGDAVTRLAAYTRAVISLRYFSVAEGI